jgi:hypothetical protein
MRQPHKKEDELTHARSRDGIDLSLSIKKAKRDSKRRLKDDSLSVVSQKAVIVSAIDSKVMTILFQIHSPPIFLPIWVFFWKFVAD